MNGRRQENSSGAITLSDREFVGLSEFIHGECGIKVTEAKKVMLEGRLQKRLRKLGLGSFATYCEYLFSSEGMEKELTFMIDEVTTNKTDFFREPAHFRFLAESVLPDLTRSRRRLTIWSAGCSSGEEPYTLAMVLSAHAERFPGFEFLVLATDISTSVLSKAEKAIYDEDRIVPVPAEFKRKYLLRSKDKTKKIVRIVPQLRSHVRFRRLNFMDRDFGFREPIDVIFCRNVIIYFDKPTQEKLLNRFCRQLAPGGYVFMGHSEALIDMKVPLVPVAPTVYRKK
jgi:chemotaxis protein methyltransferase CheR